MTPPATRLLAPLLAAGIVLSPVAQATCPSYTHKDDVIAGDTAKLPNGFVLFAQGNETGLFRSTIKPFAPRVVPGTEFHIPRSISISDDGRWAVYTTGRISTRGAFTVDSVCLVSLADTVCVRVPVYTPTVRAYDRTLRDTIDVALSPAVVGFNHGGPKGDEIWYYGWFSRGDWQIRATPVTLTGDTPVFGTERILLNVDTTQCRRRLWPYSGPNTGVVVRDQIFGLFAAIDTVKRISVRGDTTDGGLSWAIYNDFVTIPDGGNGTATGADFYRWTDAPVTAQLWGCGQTMSWDGRLCLTNTNAVGSACVPNTNQTPAMDHKGFFITPFFRSSEPPMAMNQQIDSAGISINWCPAQYRVGTYSDCGFSQWAFANNPEYIVGESEGAMAPVWGLWVVQWKTNTWTLLTNTAKTVQYQEPVMFITDAFSSVKRSGSARVRGATGSTMMRLSSAQATVLLPAGLTRLSVYSLAGRQLWQHQRPATSRPAQVHLPASIRQAQALVRMDR